MVAANGTTNSVALNIPMTLDGNHASWETSTRMYSGQRLKVRIMHGFYYQNLHSLITAKQMQKRKSASDFNLLSLWLSVKEMESSGTRSISLCGDMKSETGYFIQEPWHSTRNDPMFTRKVTKNSLQNFARMVHLNNLDYDNHRSHISTSGEMGSSSWRSQQESFGSALSQTSSRKEMCTLLCEIPSRNRTKRRTRRTFERCMAYIQYWIPCSLLSDTLI